MFEIITQEVIIATVTMNNDIHSSFQKWSNNTYGPLDYIAIHSGFRFLIYFYDDNCE